MQVIESILADAAQIAALRRDIHAHPELCFEETRTADVIAKQLTDWGVPIHRGMGTTGIVAIFKNGSSERAVGLRADMDALPITEFNTFAHKSTTAGKMHACGHDGHTAMLLAAAKHLAKHRNYDGTVYLVFQPAEEGAGGGRVMVEEGLFDRFPAQQVFGLHNWPWLPVGTFAMCPGPCMAAADQFEIEILGQGCHAAFPHTGRDPIAAAASLVLALQTIVSRQVDPVDNAVLSVTKIAGGDSYNVVPERVALVGTVRTFKPETQAFIERRMGEVADGIAAAHGLKASLRYRRGYPATVNSELEATLAADAAAEIVGEGRVVRNPPPAMGAEDFSFMLQRLPGSYIWLGTGRGGAEPDAPLHNSRYDFNDDALGFGVTYWARLVERLLPRGTGVAA